MPLTAAPRRLPMVAEEVALPDAAPPALWLRIAIGIAAILAVSFALALIAALLPAPPAPVRSPFGAGIREAAPSASGIGAYILALQASFYLAMKSALASVRAGDGGLWPLIGIGFAYGVFHAAGPGHGKAVIAGYLATSRAAIGRGLALSLAAALVQAATAIGLVGVVFLLLKGSAATMSLAAGTIERASFLAMAALGLVMVWRKAGAFLAGPEAADCGCAPGCGHTGFGLDALRARRRDWREMAGIALAAGIRPCAGAIILLVFAISQGMAAAGIAAVLAMALGTAVTTGAIAALTVFGKRLALRLLAGRAGAGWRIVALAELGAAAFVLVLGVALLIGMWGGEVSV